jgi:hypothetical protein
MGTTRTTLARWRQISNKTAGYSNLPGRFTRKQNRDITRYETARQLIEELKQTQEMLARLLALLEAGEGDKFAAHLYQSRRQYRRTSEQPNKATRL